MTALQLAVAFVLDLCLGDPRRLPHPVVAIGKAIEGLEKVLRAVFPNSPRGELVAGGVLAVVVAGASWLAVYALLALAARIHPLAAPVLGAWLGFQSLAARGLRDAGLAVWRPLRDGDVEAARRAVAMIVGRDTAGLDAAGITRAAVETVAENASDGVVAPMLFFAVGGAPLAWLYKAVNTMDSMVGYKNERYLHFGRAAARLDDAANFVPARLTALLFIAAAPLCGLDWRGAARIFRRDRLNHSSPNSAQPEAACAGALGIQLGGASFYGGRLVDKPAIGDPLRSIEPDDIPRANRLLLTAAGLGLVLLCAVRILGERAVA